MKPAMPASVRVGPHVYSVRRKTRAQMPKIDGEKPNGYVDVDTLEIGIIKGARRTKAQQWAIHECLHAMWPQGFGFEEEIIKQLDSRLLQWIQDNDALIDYLRDK